MSLPMERDDLGPSAAEESAPERPDGGLYRRLAEQVPAGSLRWAGTDEEHLEVGGAPRALESAAGLVRLLRHGGFATFYFPAKAAWGLAREGEEYWRACRDAARQGRAITRVYVLGHLGQLDDPCFLRLVNADARAGIEVLYLLARQIPSHFPRDFALWDEELYAEACFRPGGEGVELAACRYFRDGKHLADARALRRALLRVAARCSGLPTEELLLAESVGEQHRLALIGCRSAGDGQESCAWYHGSWHLLRACGVVATPAWHGDFFAQGIREQLSATLAARGRAAILISGMADYCMLYHVVAAAGPRWLERCAIDLLDLCPVPLCMGRWLEERLKRSPAALQIPLRHLFQQDLLAGGLPAASYDLVVSDSFITRFETLAARRRVVEEWRCLLAPGGAAVTTIKICSFFDEFPPSRMWRRRFVERTLEKRPPYVPPGGLETLAGEYARRVHSFPFPSAAAVRGFLDGIPGFEVVRFRTDEERGDVVGTPFVETVLRRGR